MGFSRDRLFCLFVFGIDCLFTIYGDGCVYVGLSLFPSESVVYVYGYFAVHGRNCKGQVLLHVCLALEFSEPQPACPRRDVGGKLSGFVGVYDAEGAMDGMQPSE